MDLSTTYLGFKLSSPLMPGASPLVDELDTVKRLEDAGASAIVMHSLFEEQINHEQLGQMLNVEMHEDAFAEALSYFPRPEEYRLGPDKYLEQVRKVKQAVKVPVIGSLNGTTPAGWLEYAKLISEAGADALELNVYYLATNAWETGDQVERRTLDAVKAVKSAVKIPVAVKLSPFFSSFAHLARTLDELGANGLVMFNRFIQPDLDIETLEVTPALHLSTSEELRLPLRWTAILYGKIQADLALTSGVHTAQDILKAMMAGANVTMLASELIDKGPERIKVLLDEMQAWMEAFEYESVKQMRGSMSQQAVAEPAAFERGNYMKALTTFDNRIWN
jgi:dihydroorotate dehydrogenase (fumarate)